MFNDYIHYIYLLDNKTCNKLQSIDNIKEAVVSTNLQKLSEAVSKRAANYEEDFATTLFTRPPRA